LELALNLAWLLIAVALLLLCGARALSFTQRRRRITAVVALACLVWLLFPVISITDDLNSGQSVFEATSIKKPVQPGDQVRPLLTLLYAAPALARTAWREINLHSELSSITEEFFAFDLSRRPPPQSL
jgi:hypothetical protein